MSTDSAPTHSSLLRDAAADWLILLLVTAVVFALEGKFSSGRQGTTGSEYIFLLAARCDLRASDSFATDKDGSSNRFREFTRCRGGTLAGVSREGPGRG